MKTLLLVVLLAAVAKAAVVSNDVPDAVEMPDVADGDDVADMDMNEMPEAFVNDVHELADADDLTDVAEEPAVASRRNLSQGTIGLSDVWVHNSEQRANGVNGQVTTRDIRVNTIRRITAIRVTVIGISQNATPSIVSGGIGNSFVTIRIRSAAGRGFHYRVQVFGR